ncbi:hypothetical protein CTAYLR_007662 [Chrysophaeum taylorii]|uniref:Uncharacterized protein n=1 Tax=Chrysophaeum taylorii TaxID=2483200 RepID=A0AAD7U6I5_9STRA|nr:hypothetical protein CTAYLR_007662 [Chrysophaeum taylorii]
MRSPPPLEPGGDESSSAAYATLMHTVESLQTDLQQTITTCHGLREANTQLQKNYEACKTELLRQREKFNTTRAQLIEATKAKIEADRSTELIVQKWKAQLDERTREYTRLVGPQAKLVPQDLDMLRIQVQEELELPHQQKIAELEAQGQTFQQMFFNVRRELERSKTEFEQYSAYQASAAAAEAERHGLEVSALKRRLAEFEAREASSETEDRVRQLETRVVEAEIASAELAAENEGLRAQVAEMTAASVRTAAGWKEQLCTAEAAKATLVTDAAVAEKKLASADARVEELEESRDQLESCVASLRSDAAAAEKAGQAREKQLRSVIAETTKDLERVRRDLESERAEAARREAAEARKREALDLQLAGEKRAALDARLAADEIVEHARHEAQEAVAVLEDRIVSCELASSEQMRAHAKALAEFTAEKRKLEAELKIEKARVVRVETDVAKTLQPQLAQSREAVDSLQVELDRARARIEQLLDAEQREQQALAEAQQARDEAVQHQRLAQAAQASAEAVKIKADNERLEHASALAELKSTIKTDRLATAASIRSETNAIRKKAEENLKRERKRSNAYKQRALRERDRAIKAKDVSSSNFPLADVLCCRPFRVLQVPKCRSSPLACDKRL